VGGVRGGGNITICSPPPRSSPSRGRKNKDAPSAGGGPQGASLLAMTKAYEKSL